MKDMCSFLAVQNRAVTQGGRKEKGILRETDDPDRSCIKKTNAFSPTFYKNTSVPSAS